ncbi:unnamed protein product [Meloidogyne enterolobii]|uniref:Uncharacterized protein n=1 Tax=Meloidogyne enterolobii TaxID=390850 RepID=A0ACB0ZB17_MELEN
MSSSDDENEKIFTQKLPSKRRRLSDTDKDDAVDNCIVESNEEWKNIANGFEKRWNMPLCIGLSVGWKIG